ncbi:capsid maturation protease [Streptomyces phage Scap1]|uniref:Capsid maturation protease n=1 Tax=Streptomyces phage Scap1 TaxID=2041354 RepID=A0A2D1GNX0_9CAUD|nr:head maturation protease [Streptomyces phage Scap1]ATN93658.1 capsid maturation protease [Streptomyces phage Scap1]
MGAKQDADFGGYATKAGVKCSDGRIIQPEAFKHMDGLEVPLVWQHGHASPENVLGHVLLEDRGDGVYAYGFFNETPAGKNSKLQVEHKDIKSLSIYANQLVEKLIQGGKSVVHGMIREVSLVLAGANKEAVIDYVRISHSDDPDDFTQLNDEAVIKFGEELTTELAHAVEGVDNAKPEAKTDDGEGETLQQAYDRMPDEFKAVTAAIVEQALEAGAAEHSDGSEPKDEGQPKEGEPKEGEPNPDDNPEGDLNHQEGTGAMTRNVFDQSATGTLPDGKKALTHAEFRDIAKKAVKLGSLKEALEEASLAHGVDNIEILFPDAKAISATPEWNKRRTEWVASVLNGVDRRPFSRIKTLVADITQDEARAKGYITGSYKKEEWFSVTSRKTGPTTIYKKQKLDRDDILDVTDFDIVAWLWGEIRLMIEEEIARAILFGDGRDVSDPDKIADPMAAASGDGIRSITNEHELYKTDVWVNLADANSNYHEFIETVLRARRFYKGTGRPTLFTTEQHLTEMLLLKDEDNSNRRLYRDQADLENSLRVDKIVPVEAMEGEDDLVGILVNLSDYTVGTDRGGELTRFDDFDIDYNQYKYLMETRLSGALTKIKSAQVIRTTASANVLVAPDKPTFVASTGVVTIPAKTGVVYKEGSPTGSTLTAGAQTALDAGESMVVYAVPASGYYFATNADSNWTFKRPAA